jgi:hypothetical protein
MPERCIGYIRSNSSEAVGWLYLPYDPQETKKTVVEQRMNKPKDSNTDSTINPVA